MSTSLQSGLQRRSVEVDGTEVVCWESAGAATPGAPPVVLVHGTTGSTARHYGFLVPMLARRHHVLAVDLGDPGTELTVETLGAQVVAAIEELLGGREVTLIGYSLGAVVAAWVAGARPGLVANLALVAGWMRTDTQQRLRNSVWRTLRAEGSDAIAEYMTFCAFGGPFLAARTREDLAPAIDAIALDDFADRQMDLNGRIDICDVVAAIRARTLVIGCTHDQMVPIRHSRALFATIPDARLVELGSGHAVVFERPAELLAVLEAFTSDPARHPAGTIVEAQRP